MTKVIKMRALKILKKSNKTSKRSPKAKKQIFEENIYKTKEHVRSKKNEISNIASSYTKERKKSHV